VAAALCAAGYASAPGAAFAQGAADECVTAPSRAVCVGLKKISEVVAAECRRIGGEFPSDRDCHLAVGRRVIREAIADYRSSWVHRALDAQYALANDVPFANAPWVGTHNSFNTTAEPPTLSRADSNQQLTLLQQLEVDVRNLEIDLHWIPSPRSGGRPAPVVCHGHDTHAGCTSEELLSEVLPRLRGWLAANPDQVLLMYLEDDLIANVGGRETPIGDPYPDVVNDLEQHLRVPAGAGTRSLIYHPTQRDDRGCARLPLDLTRKQVLAARAQVVVVSTCAAGWGGVVFDWGTPPPSPDDPQVERVPLGFRDDCTNDPARDKEPPLTRPYYDSKLVRFFEDSTFLAPAGERTGQTKTDDGISVETAARLVRCGVDLVAMDQLLPDDGRLEALVWSWAKDQPRDGPGECATQSAADGRWRTKRCREPRRAACRKPDGGWTFTARRDIYSRSARLCRRRGARFDVPRTGYDNERLRAAAGRHGRELWLPLFRIRATVKCNLGKERVACALRAAGRKGTAVKATLARDGTTYATSKQTLGARGASLSLRPTRAVPAGRYVLTLTYRRTGLELFRKSVRIR